MKKYVTFTHHFHGLRFYDSEKPFHDFLGVMFHVFNGVVKSNVTPEKPYNFTKILSGSQLCPFKILDTMKNGRKNKNLFLSEIDFSSTVNS